MLKVSPWYEENIGSQRDTAEFQTERVLVDLTEDLVSHMQRHDISRATLARRLGVSRPFVTNLLKGSPNLTVKTLVRVAHAAGLSVEVSLQPKALAMLRRRAVVVRSAAGPAIEIQERYVKELNDDVSALAA